MSYINEFPHTDFYGSDLRELIRMYEELVKKYDVLMAEVATFEESIKSQLKHEYSELKNEMAKFIHDFENGEYSKSYIKSLQNYIDSNLERIIANTAKFVVFGITDDGYFAIYIPQNWSEVKFDTIMVQNEDWGKLVLEY